MNATRRPASSAPPQSAADVPSSSPLQVGYGSPSHDFTLQAVMEMQRTLGQLTAKVDGMQSSIDGLKTSLDGTKAKVEDLVGWKNKIAGGVVVLSLVVTGIVAVLGFVIGKASDYVMKAPPTVGAPVAPAAAPAPLPAPAPRQP